MVFGPGIPLRRAIFIHGSVLRADDRPSPPVQDGERAGITERAGAPVSTLHTFPEAENVAEAHADIVHTAEYRPGRRSAFRAYQPLQGFNRPIGFPCQP